MTQVPKSEGGLGASPEKGLPASTELLGDDAGLDSGLGFDDMDFDFGDDRGNGLAISADGAVQTKGWAPSDDHNPQNVDDVEVPVLLEGAMNGPLSSLPATPVVDAVSALPEPEEVDGEIVAWNQVCIACPFPRCFNNRFCRRCVSFAMCFFRDQRDVFLSRCVFFAICVLLDRVHKRVWDSIYRDINAKKKSNPAQFQLELAAHKKVSVSDTLSAHKVLEFARQFPEVTNGKKRGTFDHVRFCEVYAAITFSSEETHGKYMCFIEYSRKMDRKYGWTVQQARVKWTHWKAQGVANDQKGEVDGWSERLMIPTAQVSIAGERMEYSKQMIAESKRQKALTEADYQDGLLSIKSGHSGLKGNDLFSGDMAKLGLGPSRFTGVDATGLGLFHDGKNLPSKAAMKNSVKPTGAAPAAPAGSPAAGKGQPAPAADAVEAGIGAKRLPRFQKMRKEVEIQEGKINELIICAHSILRSDQLLPEDQDFKSIVEQGMFLVHALMCVEVKTIAKVGDDGQRKEEIQIVALNPPPKSERTRSEYNEEMWKDALRTVPVDQRPKCDYGKLLAWSSVVSTSRAIKDAPTSVVIAEHEKTIADFKAEMTNFSKCLKKSVTSLDNQIKTRKSHAQIATGRALADSKKTEALRKQEEALQSRLRRVNVLTPQGQKVKWHIARAQQVERILEVDMASVAEARSQAPWVMHATEEVSTFLTSGPMAACLSSFSIKHSAHPLMQYAAAGVVFAPVPKSVSTATLMQIVDTVVPQRLKLGTLIAGEEANRLDQFFLVGRRIDKTFSSHSPSFMGQIVLPCSAMTTDIWMTDFRPFYKALCAHNKRAKFTVEEFNKQAETMTNELAELLHTAGCTLFSYLSLPKFSMLYIPPGYHIWCQSGGSDCVAKFYGLSISVSPVSLVHGKTATVGSMTEYANMYLADPSTAKNAILKAEMMTATECLKEFKKPFHVLQPHISQAMMAAPVSCAPVDNGPSSSPARSDSMAPVSSPVRSSSASSGAPVSQSTAPTGKAAGKGTHKGSEISQEEMEAAAKPLAIASPESPAAPIAPTLVSAGVLRFEQFERFELFETIRNDSKVFSIRKSSIRNRFKQQKQNT